LKLHAAAGKKLGLHRAGTIHLRTMAAANRLPQYQRPKQAGTSMKMFHLLSVVVPLIASPAFAQPAIQEPGNYAFFHPNGDLGICSSTASPHEVRRSIRHSSARASIYRERSLHIRGRVAAEHTLIR
jgi:hypothetical protein